MDYVTRARKLTQEGRFTAALKELHSARGGQDRQLSIDLLRAEILEFLGEIDEANTIVYRWLRTNSIGPAERSLCHYLCGRILYQQGHYESSTEHLQKAISIARTIKDYERVAWAQYKLLTIVADVSGWDSVGPLITELRTNAARSGNPRTMAALHLSIAETEAKRGHVTRAKRHISLASESLNAAPNAWLEGLKEQICANIFILESNLGLALDHAERAVHLAEDCGRPFLYASSVASRGHILFLAGRFERAIESFDRALRIFAPGTENFAGVLDDVVRIKLLTNQLDECEQIVRRIESFVTSAFVGSRFIYRHSLLTRVLLELKLRRSDGLSTVDRAIDIAGKTNDEWLLGRALLLKGELTCHMFGARHSIPFLQNVGATLTSQPLEVYALYETTLGVASNLGPTTTRSDTHFRRVRRLYDALGQKSGVLELDQCHEADTLQQPTDSRETQKSVQHALVDETIQTVAALALYADRPELLAREVVHLFEKCGSIKSAVVIESDATGKETTTFRMGDQIEHQRADRIEISITETKTIHVMCSPVDEVESVATINAFKTILHVLHELRRVRTDREAHTALWPPEAISREDKGIPISGQMQELMTLAQRVARTNALVLITGESGTGKEILARAVHDFSERARKPFVPFNCATVPLYLLESQLFGHRRGAFTGADHDYLGVIRSARDGTLFLDEIGELSLELQPKLLRFLESGEISPLGEPTTSRVNVRIVAATNRNLEDAVGEGRFREDLFYRINVIRLPIKPLRERRDEIPNLVSHFVARAAKEFHKGNVEVAEETMERLILYRWPGNVRQLHNEISRMVALVEPNAVLLPDMISDEILSGLPLLRSASRAQEIAVTLQDKLTPTLQRVEREMIAAALRAHDGRVDAAAKALGISRKGLYLKRQRLGL